MEKPKYGFLKKEIVPIKDKYMCNPKELLLIPHKKNIDLLVGYPPRGPHSYFGNSSVFEEYSYQNPTNGEELNLRAASISETISIMNYDFNLIEKGVFNQAYPLVEGGFITRIKEGIFTNINEYNKNNLNDLLKGARKTNGIFCRSFTLLF